MNAFESILADIAARSAEDAATLKTLGERYPDVANGILRQQDYSRKMDEFSRDRQELEGWREWRNQNWDPQANTTKAELTLKQQLAALSELEGARKDGVMTGEDGANLAELKQRLGLVSQAEVDAALKALRDEVRSFGQSTVRDIGLFSTAMVRVAGAHMKEFDEPLDSEALVAFANERKIENLGQAYDAFVSDKRAQRASAAQEAAIEAAREQGRQQAREEALQRSSGAIPVDGDGQPALGHLQARIMREHGGAGEAPIAPTAKLGSGILAQQAAQLARQRYGNTSE